MRAETLGQRLTDQAQSFAVLLRRFANRAKIFVRQGEDESEASTPQGRQAELARFYDRYEDLVEVLCDAAQYGPTASLEVRYNELRAWMHRAYPEVRPFVASYLRNGTEQDPFCTMVDSSSLAEFLRYDDGQMITRITQTREALTLYGEHLRQLASRAA